MTPDERAMVDFVLRWSPFGDGDEYILPQFGLTPPEFYSRILALAATPTDEVDVTVRALLRQFCVSKLSQSRSPIHSDDRPTSATSPGTGLQ
uniref:DUF3263 domain-containing protein n=1 Tax=Rhodococcus sp. NS1 TaxID=402236 RepID=A0A097SQN3_9NOCA|nr:hypothetical protein LRS1606.386 [Rhodococcus sp. NS1]